MVSSKTDTGQALVLTEERLRDEIAKNNCEVLLVIAAALNPTMFSETVEFREPTNPADKNYAIIRIPETGNAYAIHFATAAKLALLVCAKTAKRTEVLGSIERASDSTGESLRYVQ